MNNFSIEFKTGMSTTLALYPVLTRFERARVLGTRARHINNNSPPLVDIKGETDPLKIAEKELQAGVLPLIVRRFLGNGTYEDFRVADLLPKE